jgi:tetrahydromethanopterin S-methyltransferase subunit F
LRGQHHAGTKNARGPTGLIAGSVVAGLLILVVVVFILTVG